MGKPSHDGHVTIRLPRDLLDRIDGHSQLNGRAAFIRQVLFDTVERLDAAKSKPAAAKAPSRPVEPPKPWYETCGWEAMRDTVHRHLERINCGEMIETACVGYDTPDEYWQQYYDHVDYAQILDQLELVKP